MRQNFSSGAQKEKTKHETFIEVCCGDENIYVKRYDVKMMTIKMEAEESKHIEYTQQFALHSLYQSVITRV